METITFKDKVIIVTGASLGLGAVIAKKLASRQANLALVGRNDARLAEVGQECYGKHGLDSLCIKVDLTHQGSCEEVIKRTVERFKRIDILIKCARRGNISTIFDQSMETFDEIIAVNLRKPCCLTQLVLPYLIESKGNVINISSNYVRNHRPGLMPYAVTKTALDAFTEQVAAEIVSEGANLNVVCPGTIRTKLLTDINVDADREPFLYEDTRKDLPNHETIEPSEVATLICYVASGVPPHLSGSVLRIAGGAPLA